MVDLPSRRAVLRTTAELGLTGISLRGYAAIARAEKSARLGRGTFPQIDSMLRAATTAEEVPGVVALAASDHGIEYEGVFGKRQLQGPAMTRDTVFRIASMIKPITSVAVLQLVERGKLSLDAPVPNIDPALGSPQVLAGFDTVGTPHLRAAKWPITLRHLLTHTSGQDLRGPECGVNIRHRSIQRKLAPLDKLQNSHRGNWLNHRGNAKHGIAGHGWPLKPTLAEHALVFDAMIGRSQCHNARHLFCSRCSAEHRVDLGYAEPWWLFSARTGGVALQ